MVRGCALDSGGTTADTELVRISNCGAFQFEDKYKMFRKFSMSDNKYFVFRYLAGCVMSCSDQDGCNASSFKSPEMNLVIISIFVQSLFLTSSFYHIT